MKRGQEVVWVDIIFSPKTSPTHQTTVPFTMKHQSLKRSCRPPLRPRSEHYKSMHEKELKWEIFWKRWDIRNPPLPFNQIIWWRKASSTYAFSWNAQRPWTCFSIGYAIEASIKNNSNFIGAREHQCMQIIGQNTIPLPIIVKSEMRFWHHTKLLWIYGVRRWNCDRYNSTYVRTTSQKLHCKGVFDS